MNKVQMKYKIMRIRAKISFIALTKRMTISEMFASTILKIYNTMQLRGLLPKLND